MLIIFDANGYRWTWNGEKVYCLDDMPTDPKELEEHGYWAHSWQEAIEELNEGGYMLRDEDFEEEE